MLSLDDPAWSRLEDIYGSASGIPALLRTLESKPQPRGDYRVEPWFSLWSALCHQGDASSASYAAVPHVVRIALSASGPIDFNFYLLPACVEVARVNGRGPAVPGELASDYHQSIVQLRELAAARRYDQWDANTTQAALAALAVAHGQLRLAEALINLDSDLVDRIIAQDL